MKDSSQIASDRKIFIFIHDWMHKLPEDSISFDGHPAVGRVYPASANHDGTIKILMPEGVGGGYAGIAISGQEDDNFRWKYKIEEITPLNAYKLDIKSEDLATITKFLEGEPHPMDSYAQSLKKQPAERPEEDFHPFSPTPLDKVLMDYIPEDDVMSDSLSELIAFMSTQYEDGNLADVTARALNILGVDPDKATAALLFNAVSHIAEYSKSVIEGRENKIVLFNAIAYLLIEITQRKTNKNGNTDLKDDEPSL
jgi:hypothetical protein